MWREHTRKLWTIYAQTHPHIMWVEDDIRTFNHEPVRFGCFCPRHMKLFSERVGREVSREEALPGDVVQLGDAGGYTHAALIVDVRQGECYVAAHTLDAWMRPLSSSRPPARRVLHILGVRGRG